MRLGGFFAWRHPLRRRLSPPTRFLLSPAIGAFMRTVDAASVGVERRAASRRPTGEKQTRGPERTAATRRTAIGQSRGQLANSQLGERIFGQWWHHYAKRNMADLPAGAKLCATWPSTPPHRRLEQTPFYDKNSLQQVRGRLNAGAGKINKSSLQAKKQCQCKHTRCLAPLSMPCALNGNKLPIAQTCGNLQPESSTSKHTG